MQNRLTHLRHILKEQKLDAVLISSIPNIIYFSGYSGFTPEERDAYILVTQTRAYIFTNLLYAEAMEKAIPHLSLVEITRDHPFTQSLEMILKENTISNLGLEEDNLTVSEYKQISLIKITLKPIELSFLRVSKDANEFTFLQKACVITDKAYEHILSHIKLGVTELEIEKQFELFIKQNNASLSFRSIVAFGKNSSVPHHLAGNTKLKKNDVVLLDFGAKYENYCADVSRTFFFGKATTKQKEIYQLVLDTQQQTFAYINTQLKQGKKLLSNEADAFARKLISDKGYPPFPYSLGHGVGLEVHERPLLNPRNKDAFLPNAVFTLEPGIHLSGEIGIRIEDVFAVKDSKIIKLTHSNAQLLEL